MTNLDGLTEVLESSKLGGGHLSTPPPSRTLCHWTGSAPFPPNNHGPLL